jgi:hypothetical protein
VVAKHSTETKQSKNFDRKEGIANIQIYHPTSSGKLLKLTKHPLTSTMKMDTD